MVLSWLQGIAAGNGLSTLVFSSSRIDALADFVVESGGSPAELTVLQKGLVGGRVWGVCLDVVCSVHAFLTRVVWQIILNSAVSRWHASGSIDGFIAVKPVSGCDAMTVAASESAPRINHPALRSCVVKILSVVACVQGATLVLIPCQPGLTVRGTISGGNIGLGQDQFTAYDPFPLTLAGSGAHRAVFSAACCCSLCLSSTSRGRRLPVLTLIAGCWVDADCPCVCGRQA